MSGIKGWMVDDIRNDKGLTNAEAAASGLYATVAAGPAGSFTPNGGGDIVTTMPVGNIPQNSNNDSIVHTQVMPPSIQDMVRAFDGSQGNIESPNQTSFDTQWNILTSQMPQSVDSVVTSQGEEVHIELVPIILGILVFILAFKRG